MPLELFNVLGGMGVESADLSSKVSILVGTGLPGGDTGLQDAATVGSIYMRNDVAANNLQTYFKYQSSNSVADWKVLPDKSYVDAVVSGLSWREPAKVLDSTLYANSGAFPVGGTIDAVALVANDRVLFTNVTNGAHENVWLWSPGVTGPVTGTVTTGAGGSFQITGNYTSTFVAGTVFTVAGSTGNNGTYSVASSSFSGGLTTVVVTGSVANGTADGTITVRWVEDTNAETDGDALLITQGTSQETQYVYNGTDWVLFNSAASNAELGYIRTYIGKTAAGSTLPVYSSTLVVTQNANLTVAISSLDAAIGNRTYTGQNYVVNGQTITASIDALDVALFNLASQTIVISATNVVATGTVTGDTLPVATVSEARWMVQVRETANPSRRRAVEVHAINDSTTADYTQYGILKLGAAIGGAAVSVDVSGGNMRLRIAANNNIDYVIKRLGYSGF